MHGVSCNAVAPEATESARSLVESLSLVAERIVPGALATVMLLGPENELRFYAGPSLPEEVRKQFDGLRVVDGNGSCASAVLYGQTVLVRNATEDDRWRRLHDLAKALQIRACWSAPIRDPFGQVVGTFALTSFREAAPSDEQVQLLEGIVAVLAQILFQTPVDGRDRSFAAALRSISEGVLLTDAKQNILYFNNAFAEMTGYSLPELIGENCRILQGPETSAEVVACIRQHLDAGQSFGGEVLNYRKDGSSFWNQLSISPVRDHQGQITQFVSVQRDISESRVQREALRLSAQVFEAQEGIMITDAEQRIVRVNQAFGQLTGYAESEVLGLTPHILHSGIQNAGFYDSMWEKLRRDGEWQGEIWNRRKNGELFPEFLNIRAVRDNSGKITNYIGYFHDLTHQKAREAKLERMALHDPLTDLLNRRALEEELPRARARADRSERLLALVVLDLDDFKQINDRVGHDLGDAILQLLAQRLQDSLRHTDSVARIGGDEFILLLEGLRDIAQLESVLRKVNLAVEKPLVMESGEQIHLQVSMGASIYPLSANSNLELLLREADQAMFASKRKKETRNHPWSFWSGDESAQSLYPLRRLFRAGGLQSWYQPIWDQRQKRVVGLEALARLVDEEGRIWGPGDFLKQLTEKDIFHLTEQMLRQGISDLQTFDRIGQNYWISINVDPQLMGTACVRCIQKIVDESRVDPGRITLEILESHDFVDRQIAIDHLLDLKAMGFRIALDDIGSGYSSLLRLKELPVDKAKLDQGFVRCLEERPQDLRFVQSVLDLTRGLHVDLVAEGVESDAIRDALTVMGVRYFQGYAIARPMPMEVLHSFLAQHLQGSDETPGSYLGCYAQHISHFDILEKALKQHPEIVDFRGMAKARACPEHHRLEKLGLAWDDILMVLHREYHALIASLGMEDGKIQDSDWAVLEDCHRRFSTALLDAFQLDVRRLQET
ncbi:EAL domain-containing protein [Acidithiobacillus sp. IBUN Pt1247-S3]|uniref:bifunctional diguanylate cyclase/phosphodiesterase n=1 Tax=Acidithiobacillus sp. IBUN Pt1247-S3 TaxID=3166642 RepID=UPI0034E4DCB8